MRCKFIVGNWKMNKTVSETKEFLKDILVLEKLAKDKKVCIGIAPSYLSLDAFNKGAYNTYVYAQNVHFQENGAFTGEVSPKMLQDLKVEGSLVGHSERRIYDNETNEKCHLKIEKLLHEKMDALYCVGENLQQYQDGKSKVIVKEQLHLALVGLKENLEHLIIAYEPVWSIGTGVNASVEIAEDMCSFIRSELAVIFDPKVAENTLILYGGSVKPENIKAYLSSENIDGALVGGASLSVESFKGLIANAK